MIYCPRCSARIEDAQAAACPNCGYSIVPQYPEAGAAPPVSAGAAPAFAPIPTGAEPAAPAAGFYPEHAAPGGAPATPAASGNGSAPSLFDWQPAASSPSAAEPPPPPQASAAPPQSRPSLFDEGEEPSVAKDGTFVAGQSGEAPAFDTVFEQAGAGPQSPPDQPPSAFPSAQAAGGGLFTEAEMAPEQPLFPEQPADAAAPQQQGQNLDELFAAIEAAQTDEQGAAPVAPESPAAQPSYLSYTPGAADAPQAAPAAGQPAARHDAVVEQRAGKIAALFSDEPVPPPAQRHGDTARIYTQEPTGPQQPLPAAPPPAPAQREQDVQAMFAAAQQPQEPQPQYAPPAYQEEPPVRQKRERRQQEDDLEPAPRKERRERGGAGRIAVRVLLFLVIVVVGASAATLGWLYFSNRPAGAIDSFAEALQQKDYEKLQELSTVAGTNPTEESWAALCLAFEQPGAVDALKQQLTDQANYVAGAATPYPALRLESRPFLLFINKYEVSISGVSLLLPGEGEQTTVQLGLMPLTGYLTADGMLYSGIFPGRYSVQVARTQADGSVVADAPVTTDLFVVATPNLLGAAPSAEASTVTIENCLSDNATLYVNNSPVAEKPVNGIVTIPNVAVGSEIRIVLEQDGKMVQSTVVFADISQPALRFESYVDAAEAPAASSSDAAALQPTEAEANIVLIEFYSSYLQCINNQNMDSIRRSTDRNNGDLAQRIARPANAENIFTFVGASMDPESLVTGEDGGRPSVTFNAFFEYTYVPREGEGEAQSGSNYQTVQLVYENGQWMVNRMIMIQKDDFDSHKLATW